MIKLDDGSIITFKKISKGRYQVRIKISNGKVVVLNLDRSVLNLLQFEIDELLNIGGDGGK